MVKTYPMKRQIIYFLAIFLLIVPACRKSSSLLPKKEEAFFSSKEEAADKVNGFTRQQTRLVKAGNITTISYIHTTTKTYAFVFYDTGEGPQNLVITRSYSSSGEVQKESASTCNGATCNCQVQATIDNQGNVSIGCSCSSCTLVSSY